MSAYIFLLLTLVFAYLTVAAFRWRASIKRSPFSVIADSWSHKGAHLSLREQGQVRDRYASFTVGVGKIALLFLLVTVALCAATVRAFLA